MLRSIVGAPGGNTKPRRPRLRLGIAAVTAALCLAAAASASGQLLSPKRGQVFFGVSDTGQLSDFQAFAGSVHKHPAVIETYHPWGNTLRIAISRWEDARARPMLHISTIDPDTLQTIITPRGIATGTGDDYLLRLNSGFASNGIRAYIRPLGEPNRCLNAWSSYTCDGGSRGTDYTPYWYKQAFKRIAIIVRGGGSLALIDARLAAANLPPLNRQAGNGVEPKSLPAAPVSMVWSPLPAGSPAIGRNLPAHFYPGSQYVDWVGTDIYSRYPSWSDLTRFYSARQYRGKPFALTEWGVSAGDDPGFVKRIFQWVGQHKRTKMLIYYQDFGDSNPYRIQNYPRSRRMIASFLRQHRFPAFAPSPPAPGAPGNPNEPPAPPTGGVG